MAARPANYFSSLLAITFLLSACNTAQKTPEADLTTANETPAKVAIEKTVPEVTAFVQSSIAAQNTENNETGLSSSTQQASGKTILATGKTLNDVKVGASESPRNDGIHDNINDAIVILQNPAVAMKDFPRDRRHQVDWVQTLAQGLIEPRANLLGNEKMTELDLDIVMKNTQFMPWVKFPHDRHTRWLACSNCHPAIFEAKEGANPISMNKVLRGEYCGVCHDKVAFALFTCERCHSVTHEGSGPKWW